MFSDRKSGNLIKSLIPAHLFLLMLLTGSCSTTPASNPNAELSSNTKTKKADGRISLFDNRFSFIPPDGFKRLPATEVKRNLPDNAPRDNIYSNADQTAYISIEFGEMPLEPAQLPEVKRFTEGLHKNYSSWKTSELIEMNDRQWFHFEWEKPVSDNELVNLVAPVEADEQDPNSNVNAVKEKKKPKVKNDKPIYYHSYTTSLNKQMFSISFEADSEEYPKVKEAFNKFLQTVQTKD